MADKNRNKQQNNIEKPVKTKIDFVLLSLCTCKRPLMLKEALLSINSLKIPENVRVEVLVIDNDENETAKSCIAEISKELKCKIHYLVENKINVLEHNYGLWYDRRRDDHARVRRSDGDVWAPFYEQPFARSGKGKAWDGLSLYDLNRPNRWYWYRLREFAKKAEKYNVYLYHNHYFQHNILRVITN